MAAQLNVSYINTNNKTSIAEINIPKNATVEGSCGNVTQTMKLLFGTSGNTTLVITFLKNETLKEFMISDLHLEIPDSADLPLIKNFTKLVFHNKKTEFNTPITKSYHCAKLQQINLSELGNFTHASAVLKISHVQFEAFHTTSDANFASAQDCEESGTEIVPIAVGCALAALIIVVVIAYLVGRHYNNARGYLSM